MKREAYITTGRVKARQCPACKRWLDGCAGVSLDGPVDADESIVGCISVCAECSTVLVFTEDAFRVADDSDITGLEPDARAIIECARGLRRGATH